MAKWSRSPTVRSTRRNRSTSRVSSVATPSRSALCTYCRVFLRMAAWSSWGSRARSISRGRLGIAEQARATVARERAPQRVDRIGDPLRGGQRSSRRVRDGDPEREPLQEHLRDALVLQHEPAHLPPCRGFHLGPCGRLQQVRASRRDDQLVPALDVSGRRGPCLYAASFPGDSFWMPGSSRAVKV